uniref:Dickkopf WNT signaling pathway inhibitor 1 n=1 Tax=Sinocyclocheilus grahami TaxID=75366 RepID=A0A672R2B1_SINGR
MLHIAVFSTACLILVGCIKAASENNQLNRQCKSYFDLLKWLIHQIGMEEFVSISQENSTVVVPPKVATEGSPQNQMLKGLEGENCLRSSDCAEGLCCARHFWSKICKPVLKEGQVCTKHKRKGTHGLEIFQRCDCAEGLACRTQRDGSKSSRSLHTCQRH